MRNQPETLHAYNIPRLHWWFLGSSLLLLGCCALMVWTDYSGGKLHFLGLRGDRGWKNYQREFYELEKKRLAADQESVASGEALPFTQNEVQICGHAVEARLYAEDPERGFLPSTGELHALVLPQGEGIRIDTGVEEGDAVSPFYDPMIAKVIAYGPTRAIALERLAQALDDTRVAGPRCNARFLAALCRSPDFRAEHFDTGYIERHLEDLGAVPQPMDRGAVAAGLAALLHGDRPVDAADPWAARTARWCSRSHRPSGSA